MPPSMPYGNVGDVCSWCWASIWITSCVRCCTGCHVAAGLAKESTTEPLNGYWLLTQFHQLLMLMVSCSALCLIITYCRWICQLIWLTDIYWSVLITISTDICCWKLHLVSFFSRVIPLTFYLLSNTYIYFLWSSVYGVICFALFLWVLSFFVLIRIKVIIC